MNKPCANQLCYCPSGVPDWPVDNLSAEMPDFPYYVQFWPRVNPRSCIGCPPPPTIPIVVPDGPFGAQGCLSWVWGATQAEADHLAQNQEVACNPTDGVIYRSQETSCTTTCPDGSVRTTTIPEGTYLSSVSQERADAPARGLCATRAAAEKLCFITEELPPACANSLTEYFLTFEAEGGKAPYHFSADAAEIPNGMTLFASSLSGWPSTPGLYPITVFCTDDSGPALSTSKLFTLAVTEITTASPITTEAAGTPFTTTLTATGVLPDEEWSVVSGTLPPGLTLDTETGVISGTPLASGTSTVRLKICGCEKDFQMVVPELIWNFAPSACAPYAASQVGNGCVVTIAGGTKYYNGSFNAVGLPTFDEPCVLCTSGLQPDAAGGVDAITNTIGPYATARTVTVQFIYSTGSNYATKWSWNQSFPGFTKCSPNGTIALSVLARLSYNLNGAGLVTEFNDASAAPGSISGTHTAVYVLAPGSTIWFSAILLAFAAPGVMTINVTIT